MAKYPLLNAQKRKVFGRKVKTLRKEGILPANVFGKKVKSQAISLILSDFTKTYSQVGETGLVDLKLKGETKPRLVLISDVHLHPVTDEPLHTDLHQVDITQKVTANVPIKLAGESPAVKDKGAVLITLINEVEVEAIPTDLPEKFTLEISSLKDFNDSILAKDIPVDRDKITINLSDKESIVMVQAPKEEEEETPEEPEASEEGEAEATEEGVEGDKPEAEDDKKSPDKSPPDSAKTEDKSKEKPSK